MNEQTDLDQRLAPYFREAVTHHVEAYRSHFGNRLLAVYVWGSVHRNEAVRGISDLDLHAFIADTFSATEEEWYRQARVDINKQFPDLAGLSRPLPANLLSEGTPSPAMARAFGFRLHYDATRVWGDELVTASIVPIPNLEFARGPFEAVRDLARFAAGQDEENRTDFALPGEPLLRLRKLARLAVLGGAYLQMAHGSFRSFRGSDVLPALKNDLPEWEPFLEETEQRYILPKHGTQEEVDKYLISLMLWLDYVHQQLNHQ